MSEELARARLQSAFARLASLVEPEGYEATRWIQKIRLARQLLSDTAISDVEAVEAVRQLYRNLYRGPRNFADFFLWRDGELERVLLNDEFKAAKTAIEDVIGEPGDHSSQ